MSVNTIYVTRSPALRNVMIRVVAEFGDAEPAFKSESISASRAHYAPATSEMIINNAHQMMFDVLGHHCVVMAIAVPDRVAAAERVRQIFEEAGFDTEVKHDVQPEFPKGLLSFVTVKDLLGIAFMFWPRREDLTPEIIAELPPRSPWNE